MQLLILLALLPWLTAELFAFANKEKIDADGSQQSLMRNFHFLETVFRAFFLAAIPFFLLPDWRTLLLDIVYNAGVFLFWFNPTLNQLRNLPDDYVSTNEKKPSYLDGFIRQIGQERAEALLYKLRHLALVLGVNCFLWQCLLILKLS